MSTSPPIVPALSQGGTITGNLAVTGSISGGTVAPSGLAETVAATPAAGSALTSGTPTFLTWTAPNDGNLHQVNLIYSLQVTSLETGGAITMSITAPGGGTLTPSVNAGGSAAGNFANNIQRLVAPNTTVTVAQTSALTGGAATFFGILVGA